MLYLRSKRDIYDANGISEYIISNSKSEAEPFLLRLKSGWQDKTWRAKKKAADGIGMGQSSPGDSGALGSPDDRAAQGDWDGWNRWDDWDAWDAWGDWGSWDDEGSGRPGFLAPPVPPSRQEPSWI